MATMSARRVGPNAVFSLTESAQASSLDASLTRRTKIMFCRSLTRLTLASMLGLGAIALAIACESGPADGTMMDMGVDKSLSLIHI